MITLKKRAEFTALYKEGKSAANRLMAAYVRLNGLACGRFGFSISKKVGNAVTRNKLRRRLKALLAVCERTAGYDIVIVARKQLGGAGFEETKEALYRLLNRLINKGRKL